MEDSKFVVKEVMAKEKLTGGVDDVLVVVFVMVWE